MIEENYEIYKAMFFEVFEDVDLEDFAKELHSMLIAYQKRIIELEAQVFGYISDEEVK
jgi:hypothetical protein